jgi:hypothetical protein
MSLSCLLVHNITQYLSKPSCATYHILLTRPHPANLYPNVLDYTLVGNPDGIRIVHTARCLVARTGEGDPRDLGSTLGREFDDLAQILVGR